MAKLYLTSGSVFATPPDWPGYADYVEAIGGGAAGGSASGGGGGGGGAYARSNNLVLADGAAFHVGAAGQATWISNTGVAPTSPTEGCLAVPGAAGQSVSGGLGGAGGQASSCIGHVAYSGGDGGDGLSSRAGGGGGAAGPGGPGGAGGNGSTTGEGGIGGEGLGGAGGGGGSGVTSGSVGGGRGGNGPDGIGGGAGGVSGSNNGKNGGPGTGGGGGGAGSTTGTGGKGATGSDLGDGHGAGGGGGAETSSGTAAAQGGLYGGGGGGRRGAAGAQGILVITYTPASPSDVSGDTAATATASGGLQTSIALGGATAADAAVAGTLSETAVAHAWIGGVTDGAITCSYELSAAGNARLLVSASSDMSSPVAGSLVSGAVKGKSTVTGLAADTPYYWSIEIDGAAPGAALGIVKTFPAEGSATGVRICFASCAYTGSDAVTFDAIRAADPDVMIHMGDLHYSDITVNDPDLYRAAYRSVLSAPRQRALYRNVPLAYQWSDHDYANNNSTAAAAGRPAALATYREWVPHYPIPLAGADNDTPVYQTFALGRVRVFLLDVRSARVPGSTFLGAAQKAQLFADLAAATEEVLILAAEVPWIAGSGADSDTWYGAAAERTEICDQLISLGLMHKTVIIAGDMHASAYDDGTNSQYGTGASAPGPIVLHAAPMDQSTSTKGGPYSSGTPITDSTKQYGQLDVDFSGDFPEIQFRSYSYNGTVWSQRLTFSATLSPPQIALAGLSAAVVTPSGSMMSSIAISGGSASLTVVEGQPVFRISLAGAAVVQALVQAGVDTGIWTAGATGGEVSVIGDLAGGAAQLGGAAQALVTLQGVVRLIALLDGASVAAAFVQGDLAGGAAQLGGAAQAVATPQAYVVTEVPLMGGMQAYTTVGGVPQTAITPVGLSASISNVSGALAIDAAFEGHALAEALVNGDGLVMIVTPAGHAVASAIVRGTLGGGMPIPNYFTHAVEADWGPYEVEAWP